MLGESQPDQIRPARKDVVSVEKTKKDLKLIGRICFNSCVHQMG